MVVAQPLVVLVVQVAAVQKLGLVVLAIVVKVLTAVRQLSLHQVAAAAAKAA